MLIQSAEIIMSTKSYLFTRICWLVCLVVSNLDKTWLKGGVLGGTPLCFIVVPDQCSIHGKTWHFPYVCKHLQKKSGIFIPLYTINRCNLVWILINYCFLWPIKQLSSITMTLLSFFRSAQDQFVSSCSALAEVWTVMSARLVHVRISAFLTHS